MIGVVLAGGNGTRFSESGCCKSLLRINGKYLIEYSLENLISMRVSRAVIVVGRYGNKIREALGENYKGIAIDYAVQETPVGVIDALYRALPYWNGAAVVLQLSDEIFVNVRPQAAVLPEGTDFVCGYTVVENREIIKENYSLHCAGKANKLLHCEEKPKSVYNDKKGTGFCVFGAECIEFLKLRYETACDHFVTLCDFMNILIGNGMVGIAVQIAEEEININTTEKLAYAQSVIRKTSDHE